MQTIIDAPFFIIRKKWGPKPSLSKWLFTGIIGPKLTYAALAWGHMAEKKKYLQKLQTLNRLDAITITPFRRSAPMKGLEVIYDLTPLELFITQIAMATKQRLGNLITAGWEGTNKSGKQMGHIKYWEEKFEYLDLKVTETDKCNILQKYRNYKKILIVSTMT